MPPKFCRENPLVPDVMWFPGWCSTPNQLRICSSFSRENGHPLFICLSPSTSQFHRCKFEGWPRYVATILLFWATLTRTSFLTCVFVLFCIQTTLPTTSHNRTATKTTATFPDQSNRGGETGREKTRKNEWNSRQLREVEVRKGHLISFVSKLQFIAMMW